MTPLVTTKPSQNINIRDLGASRLKWTRPHKRSNYQKKKKKKKNSTAVNLSGLEQKTKKTKMDWEWFFLVLTMMTATPAVVLLCLGAVLKCVCSLPVTSIFILFSITASSCTHRHVKCITISYTGNYLHGQTTNVYVDIHRTVQRFQALKAPQGSIQNK